MLTFCNKKVWLKTTMQELEVIYNLLSLKRQAFLRWNLGLFQTKREYCSWVFSTVLYPLINLINLIVHSNRFIMLWLSKTVQATNWHCVRSYSVGTMNSLYQRTTESLQIKLFVFLFFSVSHKSGSRFCLPPFSSPLQAFQYVTAASWVDTGFPRPRNTFLIKG